MTKEAAEAGHVEAKPSSSELRPKTADVRTAAHPLPRKPVMPWSMKTAIEQINSVPFECEAGHLQNFDAWTWMRQAAENGPEFWPGQSVWCEVSADVAGQKISAWRQFVVVGCFMDSDTDRTFFKYSLSADPPGPWHYGKTHLVNIHGDALRLTDPTKAKDEPDAARPQRSGGTSHDL